MAYTPTVWETGDIITAEKLNKAEEGIEDNSKHVYIAEAELVDGAPVITSGDLDEAVAIMEAGGVVILTLVINEDFSQKYHAVDLVNGSIDLVTVQTAAGSGLALNGATWSATGISQWPSVV